MTLPPGYGETPVAEDELRALLPSAQGILDRPITKEAVFDLEQAVQDDVAEELMTAALDDSLQLRDLLTDHFVRDLHRRLYGDIWSWAGVFRTLEVNIGVAPEQIAMELRISLDTIRYRWEHTRDWTARELGVVAHAEGVRIHPFTDGNGRTTRLLADLVFIAAQETAVPEIYDWRLDKRTYIDLLRAYDRHRDPRELAAYIATHPLEE